jgi:hypothetical protein
MTILLHERMVISLIVYQVLQANKQPIVYTWLFGGAG